MVDRQNFYQGKAGYDPLAIKAAAQDQRLGYDMLMQYLTGSTDQGTGPFAGFLEDFFAPIATAAINALSLGNGGQLPGNIDEVFANIKSGTGGGATTNLYDYLGGLAEKAIGAKLSPGANVSYDELQAILGSLNPLMTAGMDRITNTQFRRQQGDTLRAGQVPSYWDMANQDKRKDWGDYFTKSDFYKTFYGDRPRGAAPAMPAIAGGGSGGGLLAP